TRRMACTRCHRVRGQGGDIGPDLSDVGAKLDRPILIESILEPSRQTVEGYRATMIALSDGRVLTGLAREETAKGLVLVDAEGKRHALGIDEIVDRKPSQVSLMPNGVAAELSPVEFADLVAYLETLRSTGPVKVPDDFTCSVVATGISGATAMA